jgi:hypothetical protein
MAWSVNDLDMLMALHSGLGIIFYVLKLYVYFYLYPTLSTILYMFFFLNLNFRTSFCQLCSLIHYDIHIDRSPLFDTSRQPIPSYTIGVSEECQWQYNDKFVYFYNLSIIFQKTIMSEISGIAFPIYWL